MARLRKTCGWKKACALFPFCAAAAGSSAAANTMTTLTRLNGSDGKFP